MKVSVHKRAQTRISELDTRRLIVRELKSDEVGQIISGSGWRGIVENGKSLPTGETNSEMLPYRFRGLWPNPGHATLMGLADPRIASALEKRIFTISSLNWDILTPQSVDSPATPEEQEQTQWIRDAYDDLEGGFLGSVIQRPMSCDQYGFSISEKQLDIDEETGWWCLKGLHWIAPWTVRGWLVDEAGYPLGVFLYDQRGERFLKWTDLYHTALGFYGRNPEGIAAIRSLYYTFQHKRQRLVDDAVAGERASSGVIGVDPPDDIDRKESADEFAEVTDICENIQTGDGGFFIKPSAGWLFNHVYLNEMPDATPMLDWLDHQIATRLTDNLSELGVSKSGARAVGTEMRIDKWAQLTGLCASKAHVIDYHIHRHIYRLNGWNLRRMCRTTVNGLTSPELHRRVLEYLTTPVPDNPLITKTPSIEEQLIRSVGLSRA